MLGKIIQWFRPAPARPNLSEGELRHLAYSLLRGQILESAFIGYATFYLVRKNLPVVSKEMGETLGYNPSQIGDILLVTALAYGVGKFLMGSLSDRSNPRKFIAVGMLLTALCNFAFAGMGGHWARAVQSVTDIFGLHPDAARINYFSQLLLWTLNGFAQATGYAPGARSLAHWYGFKERGTVFGFWNISHNLGGGLVGVIAAESFLRFGHSWQAAFIVPGILATICAVYLFLRMRDTPQSLGLPPIEEFKNDWPPAEREQHERELGTRELFVKYIFTNKYLWLIAIANFFVYVARNCMIDWGPTFLKEVKHASIREGGMSTLVIEFSGGAGMFLMGWLSDKFGGRRGAVSAVCMVPLVGAFAGLMFTPAGMLWLDMVLFGVVGFFVYAPVMMLGVMSLDLTSKKAVGTAAGFVGMFGYFGSAIEAKGIGWILHHYKDDPNNWNYALAAVIVCVVIAIVLLAFTWNVKPKG